MTVRLSALQGMLRLETAASHWFADMSEKDRAAYIKAHPKSRYARRGVSAPSTDGTVTKGPYRMSFDVTGPESKSLTNRFRKAGLHTSLVPARNAGGDITHKLSVHYHPNQSATVMQHMTKLGGDSVFGEDRLFNKLKRRAKKYA